MVTEETKKKAEDIIRFSRVFRASTAMGINLELMETFIYVALNPGKTTGEIVDAVKGNRSTIGRYLLDMSDVLRNKNPGYGLLKRIDHPTDLRSTMYELSPKGELTFEQLMKTLED